MIFFGLGILAGIALSFAFGSYLVWREHKQEIIEIECYGAELKIENPSPPKPRAHCMDQVGATFTVEWSESAVIQKYREN